MVIVGKNVSEEKREIEPFTWVEMSMEDPKFNAWNEEDSHMMCWLWKLNVARDQKSFYVSSLHQGRFGRPSIRLIQEMLLKFMNRRIDGLLVIISKI